jgi:hypothetical protein
MLERVYERTEIGHQELTEVIHSDIGDLLRGLSVVDELDLWRRSEAGTGVITAVPYARGLILMDRRIVTAPIDGSPFGFIVNLPSLREHAPFINRRNYLEGFWEGYGPELQAALLSCGVTYINITTFSDLQADYYHAFQALKDELGADLLSEFMHLNYSPRFAHENSFSPEVGSRFRHWTDRLQRLSGWLHPPELIPLCALVPSEFDR